MFKRFSLQILVLEKLILIHSLACEYVNLGINLCIQLSLK